MTRPADPTASRPLPGREAVHVLGVAVVFLTRVPVRVGPMADDDLRRATAAFPLVGALVAAALIAARAGLEPLVGPWPATIGAVLLGVALTGAFHEDGLADAVDGIWGGWDPEQRVRIMRDSRLGTYGATALLATLALQVSLLGGLELADFARAALAGHVLGRAAILLLVRWLGPLSDQGSGARVAGPLGPAGTAVAAVTTLAALAATVGWWTPAAVALAALLTAGVRRLARRRLGGLVGDVLGATQQVVLLGTFAGVVALARAGLLSPIT